MRFRCPYCQFINKTEPNEDGRLIACQSCGKSVRAPAGLEEGVLIGDFVIEEKIGSGSMGSVYKARELTLGRTIALKILYAQYADESGVQDFLNEARAAAKLNHPNIVQVYSVGVADGCCYICMPLLTGLTVKQILRRDHHINVDLALHYTQQIAEALHYAYNEAQIIHRDVKPENIIVSEEGVVKLTDLGLAMRSSDWHENMMVSGSPAYMSPEQFAGKKIDQRTDIYSLGVTLYEMLSGTVPFNGKTLQTIARQHMIETPVALSKLGLFIPIKVSALVRKMMAKDPEERFQNMEQLLLQIWRIRQKTAPNRDLIPSIHTVSIKRLDYDRQLAASSHEKKMNEPYSPYGILPPNFKKRSGMPYVLLFFTALIVLVLFIGLIYAYLELRDAREINQSRKEILARIDVFEPMALSNDLYSDEARAQANELKRIAGEVKNAPELARLMTAIDLAAMYKSENGRLKAYESNFTAQREQLEQARLKLQHQTVELTQLREKEAMFTGDSALFAQIKSLEERVDSERHRCTALKKALESEHEQFVDYWISTFVATTYATMRDNSVNILREMCHPLTIPDSAVKPYIVFSQNMYNVAARCDKICAQSDTSVLGRTVLIDERTLTLRGINREDAEFTNVNGRLVVLPLSDMTNQELFLLFSPAFPSSLYTDLKIYLRLRRGELAEALRLCKIESPGYAYISTCIETFYNYAKNAADEHSVRALDYESALQRVFGNLPSYQTLRRDLDTRIRQIRARTNGETDALPTPDSSLLQSTPPASPDFSEHKPRN